MTLCAKRKVLNKTL